MKSFPTLDNLTSGVSHLDIVKETVSVTPTLFGMDPAPTAFAPNYCQAINGRGQDSPMGDAGLNGVQRGVAGSRVTEHQLPGKVGPKPGSSLISRDFGEALLGSEQTIAAQAAETALVEKDSTVKVALGIEGKPLGGGTIGGSRRRGRTIR